MLSLDSGPLLFYAFYLHHLFSHYGLRSPDSCYPSRSSLDLISSGKPLLLPCLLRPHPHPQAVMGAPPPLLCAPQHRFLPHHSAGRLVLFLPASLSRTHPTPRPIKCWRQRPGSCAHLMPSNQHKACPSTGGPMNFGWVTPAFTIPWGSSLGKFSLSLYPQA